MKVEDTCSSGERFLFLQKTLELMEDANDKGRIAEGLNCLNTWVLFLVYGSVGGTKFFTHSDWHAQDLKPWLSFDDWY